MDSQPNGQQPAKHAKWTKGAHIGGETSHVWLGMDNENGSLMAVKQVPVTSVDDGEEDPELTALKREADLLKDLKHPNIVQFLFSEIQDEGFTLFLEYMPSGSVRDLLTKYGTFDEKLSRIIATDTLKGLEYLHSRGIVHTRIDVRHLLMDNKGGTKISGFGGALLESEGPDLPPSLPFLAPVNTKKRRMFLTSKHDIWSLGCLVIHLLSGKHPYAAVSQSLRCIAVAEEPEYPSGILEEVSDFLDQTFGEENWRPSATELLSHAWIAGTATGTGGE